MANPKKQPGFSSRIKRLTSSLISKQNLPLTLTFLFITFVFWFLRLNNFDQFFTFHIDQVQHISEAKQMVDDRKIRLIGSLVTTRLVEGKSFFIGPYYYYILAALGIIFNWNIYLITKSLLLMWWASSLLLTYWVGKKLNWPVALLIYFFLAAHPTLVGYSRMFLNPNFHILFSIGFFYFLYQAFISNRPKHWLLAGIFTGINISFNFVSLIYLGIAGLVGLAQLVRKKIPFYYGLIFAAGILLGDLPYVIFEIRHNFYNTRTIAEIGLSPGKGSSLFADYFLFAFIPIVIWALALTLNYLKKHAGLIVATSATTLLILYLYSTYPHPKVRGIGMPKGWSVPLQQQLADFICTDQKKNPDLFELVALITADVRAMDLRWWVEPCATPNGVRDYAYVDTLYVVDQGTIASGEHHSNWEFAGLGAYDVVYQEKLNEFLWFYKIQRAK